MWLTVSCRHLPGFDELLEAPQILANRLRWVVTEERCDGCTDFPGRRVVLKTDANLRAAATPQRA
jgi:hypothetical protein